MYTNCCRSVQGCSSRLDKCDRIKSESGPNASNASRTLTAGGASSVSSTNVIRPFPSKQPVSRTPAGSPQRHATIMSVLVLLEAIRPRRLDVVSDHRHATTKKGTAVSSEA